MSLLENSRPQRLSSRPLVSRNADYEDTVPPLPDDIWIKLLGYLTLKESCNLALMCRRMSVCARYHQKWINLTPKWDKLLSSGPSQLFNLTTFNKVKKLTIKNDYFATAKSRTLKKILQSSLSCDTLDEIEFSGDVKDVDDDLLATAVSKLKAVTFGSEVTERQLSKIVEKALKSKNLVRLHMTRVTLKNVELLGSLVGQLNQLELHSGLTSDQLQALLEKCHQSSTLTHLKLHGQDCWIGIPSQLLSGLCAKLHKFDLPYCQLSTQQMKSFLEACSTSSSLKAIDVACWNFEDISPKLISLAFSNLKSVTAFKNFISRDQYAEIVSQSLSSHKIEKLRLFLDDTPFGAIKTVKMVSSQPRLISLTIRSSAALDQILRKAMETSSLCKLDLKGRIMSDDNLSILTRILPQLHTLNMCQTELKPQAIRTILSTLQKSSKIREVDLSENRLTEVSADLLASVTDKLYTVTLEACALTREQSTKILQTSTICNLNLNDLSELTDEEIYKNMRQNKIFDATSLTTQQITFMLEKFCNKEEHIWKFSLSNQDLSGVSLELLSRFARKCGQVSFMYCGLTKEQECYLEDLFKPKWKQLVR